MAFLTNLEKRTGFSLHRPTRRVIRSLGLTKGQPLAISLRKQDHPVSKA